MVEPSIYASNMGVRDQFWVVKKTAVWYLKYVMTANNFTSPPFNDDGHATTSGNGIPMAIMVKLKYNNPSHVFNRILNKWSEQEVLQLIFCDTFLIACDSHFFKIL